jgi:hypothetical protein
MTNKARSLGNAGEAGIVKRAIKAGLRAMRQPMSGMLKEYPADVVIEAGERRVLGESKVRSLHIHPSGKKTWTIDFDWLRKVTREAKQPDNEGRSYHHGALFVRPKGASDQFVLIEEAVYFELLRLASGS